MPFVDANMRELKQSGIDQSQINSVDQTEHLTGWMSNRGRQNVASFLVKDLGLDWRLGAEWFESQLLDHDVCSNYGNWNYGINQSDNVVYILCLFIFGVQVSRNVPRQIIFFSQIPFNIHFHTGVYKISNNYFAKK